MYLRVELPNTEPVYYELSAPEVLLGTSPSSQIVLKHSSVSKKHLKLFLQGSEWSAADQGSTNGTFVKEEQIVPGQRKILTPEEDFRVGDVYLCLTKEASGKILPLNFPATESSSNTSTAAQEDKTRVINLTDLKAAAEQKKKRELMEKKAREKKRKQEDQKRLMRGLSITAVLIVLGFAGNNYWQKRMRKLDKDTVVNKLKTKVKSDAELEIEAEGFRISRAALTPRNKIIDRMGGPKCLQPEVTEICTSSMLFRKESNGVFYANKSFYFYINETEWLVKARSILEEGRTLSDSDLQLTAFLIFFDSEMRSLSFPQGTNIYAVFYKMGESNLPFLTGVFAVRSQNLADIFSFFSEAGVTGSEEKLNASLASLKPFYSLY